MPVLDRSLTVTLDGEPMPFAGRIRLRGKDELSLFPALFTLELWNLPEEHFLRLSRAREISVSHLDACLVVFADVDIDAWLETGEAAVPGSARRHALSDGFAFVGFRTG